MAVKKLKNDKVIALTKDPKSIVVVANNCWWVKFIHSCKNSGGIHTNVAMMVGALIGHGACTFLVAIGVDLATSSKQVTIPSADSIWTCMNVKELKSLSNKTRTTLTPPPTQEGVRRSIRISMAGNMPTPASTTVQEEAGTPAQTYNKSSVKIPTPCLSIMAFGSNSIKPLDLIIAVKTNAIDFNDAHKDAENIEYEDTKEGAEDFVKWLYAVHLGLIKEIQLSVEADNEDLICYFEERHCLCILPPLGQGQGLAPDPETNDGILQQLIEATNQNDKVCKEMNRIWLSEYEWKKDQEEEKKR